MAGQENNYAVHRLMANSTKYKLYGLQPENSANINYYHYYILE